MKMRQITSSRAESPAQQGDALNCAAESACLYSAVRHL
jgi:hypothetical protein